MYNQIIPIFQETVKNGVWITFLDKGQNPLTLF